MGDRYRGRTKSSRSSNGDKARCVNDYSTGHLTIIISLRHSGAPGRTLGITPQSAGSFYRSTNTRLVF